LNDDNPLTVNRGGVNWTYAYNELSLPTSATLALDARTYAQGYTYSNAAALTGYTLPSGKAVVQGVDVTCPRFFGPFLSWVRSVMRYGN
jgi:YD repeat-containing protein